MAGTRTGLHGTRTAMAGTRTGLDGTRTGLDGTYRPELILAERRPGTRAERERPFRRR
jgi:hypothetical protein